MALFQYNGIGSLRSLGNKESTQRAVYSYTQFSIVNYEELDYGSIVDAVIEAEDYGEITATIEQYYQIQDFGTITLDTARVPMGKFGIHLAANDTTTRVSVGGVEFALYGRAITTVFFSPINRVFDFQGEAYNKISSSWLGRGNLSTVESEGVDAVGASPATSTLRLKISGEGIEQVIFNPQDRVFNFIGEAEEKRTYQYDQSDDIDFGSDDWGFLTEPVLRSEDYGLITDLQDIPVWDYSNIEDWGLITENTTNKVYGRSRFAGNAEERFIFANYDGSWGNKQPRLLGTGIGYATPKHIGEGFITVNGTPRIQIRMHYKADGGWDFYPQRFRGGSLFGLSSGTETSIVSESATAKLFSINSTTTFKAGRSEVGVSENDILVRGGAVYTVIFNQVDRVFTFRNVEINRRAYAYNESSIVNVEGIDYGYITDTVTLSEDYGFVGNQDLEFPWEVEDFGILDPRETRTPFGLARFYSSTETPRVKSFVAGQEGSAIKFSGEVRVYVLPQFKGSGTLTVTSATTDSRTNSEVGTGSLFGFSSTTESTLVQPPIDETQTRIFTFNGKVVERFGKGNYDGTGTLFGLSSATETRLVRDGVGELFRINGKLVERSTFNEVGTGSLFGFAGAGESITFSYNEDSGFGACDGEDYGFISESVYNVEESPSISGYASTPISTLANEIVSEFGRQLNAIDYGVIGEYYQYNHEDYGNLHPDDCLEPQGTITFHNSVDESRTKVFIGSGRIGSVSGAAEAIAVVPSAISLFKFAGSGIEKNTESYVGSGSLFTFVSKTESTSFAERSKGLFKFNGTAIEKNTESYVGTGSIFSFSSTTKALVSRPPTETALFRINGSLHERRLNPEIGSGSLFTYVSFTETRVISEFSTELFKINGGLVLSGVKEQVSDLKFTAAWKGSGTLFEFSSTAPSRVRVFTGGGEINISGAGTESTTPTTEIGSGSLFSYVSFTQTKSVSESSRKVLFKFSGAATNIKARFAWKTTNETQLRILGNVRVYVLPKHRGSGSIFIRSSGVRIAPESFTPWIPPGKGRLYGFGGAAKSFGANPPESIALFKISGSIPTPKRTFSERKFVQTRIFGNNGNLIRFSLSANPVGLQPIHIDGHLKESKTPAPHIGSGRIFTFVSATQSKVINPPDQTTLFKINGAAKDRKVKAQVGSGRIFSFGSKTESRAIVQKVKGLFKITGFSKESKTPAPHIGKGSIFTFVSATKSTVVRPKNPTTLFTIGGSATARKSIKEIGIGTPGLDINGSVVQRKTKAYRGVGSLFGFSSKTESRVVVPPNLQNLFTVRGSAKQATAIPRTGSGSIFGFVGASESKSNVEVNITLFKVTGTSTLKFTRSNVGVGQVRVGLSNPGIPGDISRGITVFRLRTFPQGPLVKFSGTKAESFTPAPHISKGLININPANSRSRYVEYQRPQPTRIIVI
jgi:hypothetical protein